MSDDPFVPTPQDLAGFWDMVHIQVDHIHSLFADLKELRANGWERKKQQVRISTDPSEPYFVSHTNKREVPPRREKWLSQHLLQSNTVRRSPSMA